MKISAVYKIVNTVTGEFYIGSSNDVKRRWKDHRCPSRWKQQSNNKLYQDFQKFGLDNFDFQVLCPVMPEYLTQVEQELIEMLQPTYNNYSAKGLDTERYKEADRRYRQSEKCKETHKKYRNQLCSYNNETLTLGALSKRFLRKGLKHPTLEAKKYLLSKE